LDTFHHHIDNTGQEAWDLLDPYVKTWKEKEDIPVLDCSSQEPGKRPGKHAETITLKGFETLLEMAKPRDFDLMLESKDKEASALKAVRAAARDDRFRRAAGSH
jgi:UV DNA damage endonuclease